MRTSGTTCGRRRRFLVHSKLKRRDPKQNPQQDHRREHIDETKLRRTALES